MTGQDKSENVRTLK